MEFHFNALLLSRICIASCSSFVLGKIGYKEKLKNT
jgi:hypothetical protein